MVYRGEYDPYGNLVYEWGSAGLNTRKFTGYERDGNTGLDYASARMYGPGRGRFMQPDPAGLKGAKMKIPSSLNRYSYVNNDPVNMVDGTGTTGIYFYLNPCIFMICDSMTVSAGLSSTIGHNPNMFPGEFLPEEGGEDQGALGNPFQGAYEACKDKIPKSLATDQITNFTFDVAHKIMHITGLVGNISEALLAVTWAMESRFEWNPESQYNDNNDSYNVGPMQLNSYFTANDIGDGFYNPSQYGFKWEDVMGTYSKGSRFNGNHHANILVGALKLKWLLGAKGSEREAARAYVGSTGESGPEARKMQYDLFSTGFKTFFDCYKNNLGL